MRGGRVGQSDRAGAAAPVGSAEAGRRQQGTAMQRFPRGYFTAPTGQVHFRRAGPPGGEPLLLLHQSPLSSVQFEAVLPGLRFRGFDAVALDMPGFGMSDAAPEGATLAHYASILPAALGHFGWSSSHLVGHHTGAVIAAEFAAAEPARTRRLVLNGFPLLSQAEREHFATFYFGPKDPVPDGTHLLTAWHNRLRSTPGWTDLALMHRYTVEGLYRGETNWKAFPLVIGADLGGQLAALQVPTLLLTNTGEDLYEATQRSCELRPGFFAYRALQGGTHDIIDEQPEAWIAAVSDFLGAKGA
jgi:pimeloyl-ACP methyl ester carboxylesterase